MAIITRFGGSGGGTPVVDPYPHVWECTVVQSGTIGVVSGVVQLEQYDILHYTMPLGFSTYDLMIGGTTYTTSFLNDGEMYIQWDGNDFVEVSASAGCSLPHVWTSPTYTITGSVLEITGGVDDLRTNDVIILNLTGSEYASVIEYNSQNYTISDTNINSRNNPNYVRFDGTKFIIVNKMFRGIHFDKYEEKVVTGSTSPVTVTFNDFDLTKCLIALDNTNVGFDVTAFSAVQNGTNVDVTFTVSNGTPSVYIRLMQFNNARNASYTFTAQTNVSQTQDVNVNITDGQTRIAVKTGTTRMISNPNNWHNRASCYISSGTNGYTFSAGYTDNTNHDVYILSSYVDLE